MYLVLRISEHDDWHIMQFCKGLRISIRNYCKPLISHIALGLLSGRCMALQSFRKTSLNLKIQGDARYTEFQLTPRRKDGSSSARREKYRQFGQNPPMATKRPLWVTKQPATVPQANSIRCRDVGGSLRLHHPAWVHASLKIEHL